MKKSSFRVIKALSVFVILFCSLFSSTYRTPQSFAKPPPVLSISHDKLDFKRVTKDTLPSMVFVITNNYYNSSLIGTLKSPTNWIKLSATTFDGDFTVINVQLDLSNLNPNLYQEKIEIVSNGESFLLPVRVDLVVKKSIDQFTWDNQRIFLNSNPTILGAAPFVKDNLGWIPLRAIFESFGADVTFDNHHKDFGLKIDVVYKDIHIEFLKNQKYMLINGKKYILPMEIYNRAGITFIPMDVLSSTFKPEVIQNYRTYTIIY